MNANLNAFDLNDATTRLIAADRMEEQGSAAEAWFLRVAKGPKTAALSRAKCKDICQLCAYDGRKITLKPGTTVRTFDNAWDGGSRVYYYVLDAGAQLTRKIPDSHEITELELKPGMLVIEHSFFCGKDCGLTINGTVETLHGRFGGK